MFTPGRIIHNGRTAAVCRSFAAVILLGLCVATASAASINYGNHGPVPPGVTFTSVTESSSTDPVPLYGPPTAFSVGMDFDPTGFASFANGGSNDVTDGQLNFGIQASPIVGISSVGLFEAGDFTLAGSGTSATQTFAGAILRVTVTQIDGVNVAPINLTPVNASVGFNLAANPGIVQPWSLGLSLNVAAQLTSLGYTYQAGATGLEVVIDNQLLAFSEANSVAGIEKKEFRIDLGTNPIPEPATSALLGCAGLFAAGTWLRRRRAARA